MKSLKQLLLLEHDMDKTWEKHGEKIAERLKGEGVADEHKEFFQRKIAQGDPTQNKEYGGWIAHKYSTGGINRHEDIDARVRPALEAFHSAKVRKQLSPHGINADINTYKSLPELESAVDKIPKKESKRQEAKQEADKFRAPGISTHHDEEHWHIVVPHTVDAAIHYGQNTKWCTTAKNNNYFDTYNKQGPLHIMVPKKPKWAGEKYQLHMESGQFMNELDAPANSYRADKQGAENLHNPETIKNDVFKDRPSPFFNKLLDKPVEDNNNRYASPHQIHIQYGPQEKLDQLVNSKNYPTRELLAKRGFKAHLDKLVNDPEAVVRSTVARHGHKEHLDKLVNDPSSMVRQAVLEHGNHEHVEKLANDQSPEVLQMLGTHGLEHHVVHALSNVSGGTLDSKGKPEYTGLIKHIEGLKTNKHISSERKVQLIEPFLNHEDKSVSSAAFKHYHPEHWNRYLSSTKGEDLGRVMNAYNAMSHEWRSEMKMPAQLKSHINNTLVTHPNADMRKEYAARTDNPQHLEKLAQDPERFVRSRVAMSPHAHLLAKETQIKLAGDEDRFVASSMAENTSHPCVAETALTKHENHPAVLGAISQNLYLDRAVSDSSKFHQTVKNELIKKHFPAYEKALSEAPVHQMVRNNGKATVSKEPEHWGHISAVVAKNTKSTAAIQNVIDKGYYRQSSYSDSQDTRGNIIRNKATTDEQVKQLVAKHPSWMEKNNSRTVKAIADRGIKEHLDTIVREKHTFGSDILKAVAKHGHPEHLEALSTSGKKMVRQVVAKKAPLALAQKMTGDRNTIVATNARNRVTQLKAQAEKEALGVPSGAVRMSRVKHGKYANDKYREWGRQYRERKKQRLAAARNPGNEGGNNP